MIRPYAHRDLVLKLFCQIVSVHNFLLSIVLLVTLPAATINFSLDSHSWQGYKENHTQSKVMPD